MTDYPIIFNGPMVCALLDGRKTQTRRASGPQWQKVKPGDRLWVRETWQQPALCEVQYRATDTTRIGHWHPACGPWRPSNQMPRWASRLTLTVTGVKVERLQAISEDDARAEGISVLPFQDQADPSAWWQSGPGENQARSASASFRRLWKLLYYAPSWDANPEVVAFTFKVDRRNIDEVSP
jgi:hypothetical protein